MYSAAPLDKLLNFYKDANTSPYHGVWSVLVTSSASNSVDFAKRYADIFNSISQSDWNLAVCASRDDEGNWIEDKGLQSIAELIKNEMGTAGRRQHSDYILFFDPRAVSFNQSGISNEGFTGGGFTETCLVLPLDFTKIADNDLYRKTLLKAHQAIREAFLQEEVEAATATTSDRTPYILSRISSNMLSANIVCSMVAISAITTTTFVQETSTDLFQMITTLLSA